MAAEPPSWIWRNRKWRHSIRRPRKPQRRTKHEVDRTTPRGDMAIWNIAENNSYWTYRNARNEGPILHGRPLRGIPANNYINLISPQTTVPGLNCSLPRMKQNSTQNGPLKSRSSVLDLAKKTIWDYMKIYCWVCQWKKFWMGQYLMNLFRKLWNLAACFYVDRIYAYALYMCIL